MNTQLASARQNVSEQVFHEGRASPAGPQADGVGGQGLKPPGAGAHCQGGDRGPASSVAPSGETLPRTQALHTRPALSCACTAACGPRRHPSSRSGTSLPWVGAQPSPGSPMVPAVTPRAGQARLCPGFELSRLPAHPWSPPSRLEPVGHVSALGWSSAVSWFTHGPRCHPSSLSGTSLPWV